jgi:uncharacterized protein (TIGR00251 family)
LSHPADPRAPDGDGGWLEPAAVGWSLLLWVQPGARRTEVQGIADGRLRLRLAAPPVDGKANEALQRWLAERLGLRLREVELVSGQTGRRKRVRLECALPQAEIRQRLLGGN